MEGHTDSDGSAPLNGSLSKARAAAVAEALLARGAQVPRASTAGFSFKRPVASNATAADLAQGSKRGRLVGDSLTSFVNDALRGARIEDLRTRYAAVATDLRSGKMVLLRSGSVADAVRASCSIPGVFVPRELGARERVDGSLVSPLPVRAAPDLGCDVVLAVDVGTRPNCASLPGMYELLLQSFEFMGRALSEQKAQGADVVLRPDASAVASTDFNARRDLIQAGYGAAQRALPELQRRLSAPAARPRRG